MLNTPVHPGGLGIQVDLTSAASSHSIIKIELPTTLNSTRSEVNSNKQAKQSHPPDELRNEVSSPVIMVECHNQSEEGPQPDTMFPIAPVLTECKTVIDYLAVPVPRWFTFGDDEAINPQARLEQQEEDIADSGNNTPLPTRF